MHKDPVVDRYVFFMFLFIDFIVYRSLELKVNGAAEWSIDKLIRLYNPFQ